MLCESHSKKGCLECAVHGRGAREYPKCSQTPSQSILDHVLDVPANLGYNPPMRSPFKQLKVLLFLAFLLAFAAIPVATFAQMSGAGFAKNVTTSGTAVALSASITVRSFSVTAKTTNTGTIYLGGSDVQASGLNGQRLVPGQSVGFTVVGDYKATNLYNLGAFYIDATVSGEGVSVFYTR